MRTATIVANPSAGAGRALIVAERLERELQSRGIRTTRDELAGADVAIAVGGDGTLNRLAAAILRIDDPARRPALAFLGAGTGNVAARAFGFPRDPRALAALIAGGRTRTIDAGVVSRDGARVAVFLLWAGAGVDASLIESVARTRAEVRGWRVTVSYVREAMRLLVTYRFPEIRLSCEEGLFGGVLVGNVGRLAIGSVTTTADPSDGLLNVIATEPRSRAAWVGAAMLSALHQYHRCPRVRRPLVDRVRIESDLPVALHVDGEPLGTLPADIHVLPAAIRLCTSS